MPHPMRSPFSQLSQHGPITAKPLAAILMMVSTCAFSQSSASDAGIRPKYLFEPRISITETFTDNLRLSATNPQSEQITELSPGIRLSTDTGRLKAYFDYSLIGVLYAKNSSSNAIQNALTAFGTVQAVDNWAFVDFSGSIAQQSISAFGKQSSSNTSINGNQAEVSSYRISPYLRGRLGDMANYEARYSRAISQSDTAARTDSTATDGIIKVNGDTYFRNLGWTADVSQNKIDYREGRPTEADRFNLGLSYTITPQVQVFANAGRESNNYTSLDKQSIGTSGFGVSWSPSEVTKLTASKEQRSFGDSHSVRVEHRTARTAWLFTDTKDVSVSPIQSVLFSDNPNPSPGVINGFLTTAVSIQRRQDLSVTLLGVRDTISLNLTKSEISRLDTVTNSIDDLSNGEVRQRGFNVNYAHRLSPEYSLVIFASKLFIAGSANQQDSTLSSLKINVSGKVGRRATGSIGLRRAIFSNSISPYGETAVIIHLNVPF